MENEKPEVPTSREAGKSVLGPEMWAEVLQRVIAPRIANTIQANPAIENRHELHRKFCEGNCIRVSYSTFSGWCEDLGITFKKRIEVTIPGWKPQPAPRVPLKAVATTGSPVNETIAVQVVNEPELPSEPVTWDEPRPVPSQVFGDDGLPNVLPGGLRGPAFFDNKDYAN